MGEVAGLLAHQLNQPLAAIRALGEASLAKLKSNQPDLDWVCGNIEDLVGQTERAAQVIRELRTFLTRQSHKKSTMNLNSIVQSACQLTLTSSSNIFLEQDLAGHLPLIHLRPVQVEQVIVCLLQNAIEELAEGNIEDKMIRISTVLKGKEALVTIQDNGRGVSAEIAQTIFAPLFTTKKNGIGLGLSISRSIIEEHGGRIWAEPGSNGIFRFTLPLPK